MLHRFWFEFDISIKDPYPGGVLLGCGVTAFNYDDAMELIRRRVFANSDLPAIRNVIHDVDVSTLDAGHVLPNMGVCSDRGIWFPIGYD